MSEHERHREAIPAYLLGALPELEEQVLERHLRDCAQCQADLEHLRPAVGVLAQAPPQVAPPPGLKRRILDEVRTEARGNARAERRVRRVVMPARRGRRSLAVAVAAALAGLVVGAGVVQLADDSELRTLAATVDSARLAQASARLVTTADDADTAILRADDLPALPGGRVYEVWVKRGDEVRPVALFQPEADGDATAGVHGLEGADAVLVTREPRGGSAVPSEEPVIAIPLPS